MSRRDIIIIAVLINAGLLIVLFSSALKSSPAHEDLSSLAAAPAKAAELTIRKDPVTPSGDEVDQVLSEYSRPVQSATNLAATNVTPVESSSGLGEKKEMKSNFADDLQALTTPSAGAPAFASTAPVAPAATPTPVAAAPVVEKASPQFKEVKVKKGDVLEKIAKTHHTSVEEIMKVNQMANTRLKIGQVLKIPQGAKKSFATPAASSTPKFYTVKNGDNPWTIAVKNHMKVEELLKLNQMDAEKARHLKPGDKLRIQ